MRRLQPQCYRLVELSCATRREQWLGTFVLLLSHARRSICRFCCMLTPHAKEQHACSHFLRALFRFARVRFSSLLLLTISFVLLSCYAEYRCFVNALSIEETGCFLPAFGGGAMMPVRVRCAALVRSALTR